jgi:ketosteroid isomerase-like protein
VKQTFSVGLLLLFSTLVWNQGATSIAPSGTDEDKAAVMQTLDQFADAGMKRDADTLSRLYSENYFHTNANGSIMERAEVLASYKAPSPVTFKTNQRDEYRFQLFPDAAVVSNRVTLRGTRPDGSELTSRFRTTTVLVKLNGRWTIVNSHASFLEDK